MTCLLSCDLPCRANLVSDSVWQRSGEIELGVSCDEHLWTTTVVRARIRVRIHISDPFCGFGSGYRILCSRVNTPNLFRPPFSIPTNHDHAFDHSSTQLLHLRHLQILRSVPSVSSRARHKNH
ncbi:hypothetical protein L1887_30764 [Cichorium endivia]|nr:hypothetical protein L1887_30764 [Cichorium endivia]